MAHARIALLLFASLLITACAPSTPPDGSLPCDPTIDVQRAVGFDVALEATIPLAAFSETPSEVDSGRECSEKRSTRLHSHSNEVQQPDARLKTFGLSQCRLARGRGVE